MTLSNWVFVNLCINDVNIHAETNFALSCNHRPKFQTQTAAHHEVIYLLMVKQTILVNNKIFMEIFWRSFTCHVWRSPKILFRWLIT